MGDGPFARIRRIARAGFLVGAGIFCCIWTKRKPYGRSACPREQIFPLISRHCVPWCRGGRGFARHARARPRIRRAGPRGQGEHHHASGPQLRAKRIACALHGAKRRVRCSARLRFLLHVALAFPCIFSGEGSAFRRRVATGSIYIVLTRSEQAYPNNKKQAGNGRRTSHAARDRVVQPRASREDAGCPRRAAWMRVVLRTPAGRDYAAGMGGGAGGRRPAPLPKPIMEESWRRRTPLAPEGEGA